MLDKIDLPIQEIIPECKNKLSKENTLIVSAPPGAGKSTLLPLALMDEPWLEGQKILMLEPRRLAARSIAERMSVLIDDKVGNRVGFRIRFESKTSQETKIEVLTEGILTKMLQSNSTLDGVGMVVFDEFHERSIHADVALALCRESQKILRPDLRILIMSATLDMSKLSSLLNCPVLESKGKQYPVDIKYEGEHDLTLLPELAARTIKKAIVQHEGDVLAFFPGQGEILKCQDLLKRDLKGIKIHPFYGQLPQGKQYAAIMPDRSGTRKVVLATSIAETSLTIEGIKVVVDTGYGRSSVYDSKSGISRLVTHETAKDSSDQRAGRAGRLSPGICYRIWTKATQDRKQSFSTPEILEADLTPLALEMALWGIKDPSELTWLTPPPAQSYLQSQELLIQLEAIEDGKITDHGKKMQALPCHPRIAHMLIRAEEDEMLPLATDIASILEERDPLGREAGTDLNVRIETLRLQRSENRLGKRFSRLEKISSSYRKMFDINVDDSPVDPYETGYLLSQAFPERIACNRPGNNAQFQLANGKYAMLGHKDDLAHEQWLAVAHVDARDGMGKIFMASPLNPRDLAPLVKEKETVEWNIHKGGLQASKDLRIGNIVLKSEPIRNPKEELVNKSIHEVVRTQGEQLLDFDEEFKEWQNRVLSLRLWNPDESWPDVSTEYLLKNNETWLGPYLQNIRNNEHLKKLNLTQMLSSSLEWEQQQRLEKSVPLRISVPSGSNIKLKYNADGSPPVLAVRLQEVFGLAETPAINNGKTKVLMHLLSPGYKPVQVTSDLKNFWNETYFEVRKELKRRYPKHSWPDDPWAAEPMRGVKRKKE